MKGIIGMMVVLGLAFNAEAQSSKSKKKNSTHKTKAQTQSVAEQQLSDNKANEATIGRTIGSGALPTEPIIVYDSTTSSEYHYNPYRKFTPAEAVPEDPAPGFENVDKERNRLPRTDELREPRK